MRTTTWKTFLALLLAVDPQLAAQAGCGTHCPLPTTYRTQSYVVQPVTTLLEVAIPVAAVSFTYLPPAMPSAAPNLSGRLASSDAVFPAPHWAADLYDAGETSFTSLPGAAGTAGAALLQQRCASCHGTQARGGVRLFDAAGNLQPTKAGAPLTRRALWEQIRSGRMPPSGPLPENEKLSLVHELLE